MEDGRGSSLATGSGDSDRYEVVGDIDADSPKDKKSLVLVMMTLCGAGFLFPFNSYIGAVDFLEERYPSFSPEFVIPFVYIYITCVFVGSNLIYGVGSVSIKSRIRFGYVLFVIALASVPLIENGAESGHISRPTGFWLTLFTVGLIAVGGGIQQSSFYGFAAFLPPKYTQGLMFGESLAGVIVSFNRIWTKASNADTDAGLRDSTFLFFYMSIVFIVSCFVLHEVASRSEFTQSRGAALRAAETPKQRRKRVAELVVSPMLAVAGSFIVTLSVFPGVTSAVPSKAMRDWMPIVMMAVFNVGDLIGKALPFLPFSMFQASSWTTAGLIKFVAARVPLIVILVLCAAPYPLPALRGEAWGLIATFVLAVSGGYTATIAMTIGPMQVPAAGQ
eukprot:gene9288-22631_t